MTAVPSSARRAPRARLRGRPHARRQVDRPSGAHRRRPVRRTVDGDDPSPGHDVRSTADCLRALGVTVIEDGDRIEVRWHPGCATRPLTAATPAPPCACSPGPSPDRELRVTLDGDAPCARGRWSAWRRSCGRPAPRPHHRRPRADDGRWAGAARGREPPPARRKRAAARRGGPRGPWRAGAAPRWRSGPTRDHTERMLAWTGVPVRREGRVTTLWVPPGHGRSSWMCPATHRLQRRGSWPAPCTPTPTSRSRASASIPPGWRSSPSCGGWAPRSRPRHRRGRPRARRRDHGPRRITLRAVRIEGDRSPS